MEISRNQHTLVHFNVYGTPPDIVLASFFKDDTLILWTTASLLTRKVDQSPRRGNDGAFVADGVLVEQGGCSISLDLDAVHVESSMREVLQFTTND